MRFSASAPCKAILFGEHYVVYGSPALALPIEPRNAVEFSLWQGSGIALKSELGNGSISSCGEYEGPDELSIFAEVAGKVFESAGAKFPSCVAEFKPAWKLKGVGTSASLCAAFAAGLLRLKGEKIGAERVFAAAQSGDVVAHGGRASGIDAKTVSYGKPLVFQRSFSPPSFNSKPVAFRIPRGASLLLIDTFSGRKEGTLRMLQVFASQFGISKKPDEANEGQRLKIREEYAPLWKKIKGALAGPDAKALGALLNENHSLLKMRKMTSDGIDRAVAAALAAGAYGAKMTGGGGEGGAALALVDETQAKKAAKGITEKTGFPCHLLSLARKGASAT